MEPRDYGLIKRDRAAWVATLPPVIAELEREWELRAGEILAGGSESYVVAAGADRVLKIALPGTAFENEVRALRAGAGCGFARLFRHDPVRNAILLERLGPSLRSLDQPVEQQIATICQTLQKAWSVPADPQLPTGVDKARWLVEFIDATWHDLTEPCPERVIDRAREFAANRTAAAKTDHNVLVHGDAHPDNTLLDERTGEFKFVDPDGLRADKAYDLAIPMRDWTAELLAGDPRNLGRERCAYLSELTGVDPESIWQWGFIERVSTGLLLLRIGDPAGHDMLTVAAEWAG